MGRKKATSLKKDTKQLLDAQSVAGHSRREGESGTTREAGRGKDGESSAQTVD